jgi:hypothetical protein
LTDADLKRLEAKIDRLLNLFGLEGQPRPTVADLERRAQDRVIRLTTKKRLGKRSHGGTTVQE